MCFLIAIIIFLYRCTNCKYPEGRAWAGMARRRAGVPWAVLGLDNKLVVPARHGTMCQSYLKI